MKSQIDFSARASDIDIDQQFIQRWSPRAFQKHVVDEDVLERVMEAARWAPSCFNAQPWRFFTSSDATFNDFLELLVEGNQSWAKDCSVIGFLIGQKNFEYNGEPNAYAGFDSGAAWMSMSLQARKEGLYTHGMGGIKADAVADYLKLDPAQSEVLMGFTIGKLAEFESLSDEQLQNEVPNSREALSTIWRQL